MENNKTLDILKTAILLEKRGKEFYSKVASQTNIESVKKIFELMSAEEDIHIEELSKQYLFYDKNKSFTKNSYISLNNNNVANFVLSEEMKHQISAAMKQLQSLRP